MLENFHILLASPFPLNIWEMIEKVYLFLGFEVIASLWLFFEAIWAYKNMRAYATLNPDPDIQRREFLMGFMLIILIGTCLAMLITDFRQLQEPPKGFESGLLFGVLILITINLIIIRPARLQVQANLKNLKAKRAKEQQT